MGKSDHVPQIDALRGIAALVVAFVFHQHYLSGDQNNGPLNGLPVFTWLHHYGWTMVDLFFVISGFIMCHVYLRDPDNPRPAPSALRFANARFARLYPLHLVALLVTAVVLSFGIPPGYDAATPDAWHFGLNLLMLQQTPLAEGMSFDKPSWSIAVEIYCYAAFYVLIRWRPHWLTGVALAIVIAAALAAIPEGPMERHAARGFCGFFSGVLLWRWGRYIPTLSLPFLMAVPIWFLGHLHEFSKGCLLSLTTYPALVLLALRTNWLEGKVFAWLGSRSYAIYLVHAPIYYAGSLLFFDGQRVPGGTVGEELLPCFAAILITAHFSYKYLEDPARRWLRMRPEKAAEPALAAA